MITKKRGGNMDKTHPSIMLKQVGAKIAYFRSLRGLTQEELAIKISVSQSVISRVERGQYNDNIGIVMLWKIALALRIEVHMLVMFTEFEKNMWWDEIGAT